MALGLEVPIQLPPPEKRPWGLLVDVATEIPAASFVSGGNSRLGLGIQHVPWGCAPLMRGDAECSTNLLLADDGPILTEGEGDDLEPSEFAFEDKGPALLDFDDLVVHPAFKVVDGLRCSTLSLPDRTDVGFTGLQPRLLARMRTLMSNMLMAELQTGFASMGPSLNSEALDLGEAGSVAGAAVLVEQHLADVLHGVVGTVFIPPPLLHLAVVTGWVTREGSTYRTRTGHLVIADSGHSSIGPGSDPADFTIYASGPISFHVSDTVLLGAGSETLALNTNIRERLAEAYAQLGFDPCAVAATSLDESALDVVILTS